VRSRQGGILDGVIAAGDCKVQSAKLASLDRRCRRNSGISVSSLRNWNGFVAYEIDDSCNNDGSS
jgi:hypothetical protein